MTKEKLKLIFGDVTGAFADGGILFPLLVMLALQGSFSAPKLFASAGLAYLFSGWFFRIPISVQPLKAIAIAALAVGATGSEIRLSGFCLGVICVAFSFFDVNRLAKKIPTSIVHCVQLGLGVILFTQGLGVIAGASVVNLLITAVFFSAICALPSFSLLGILAAGGLVAGFFFPSLIPPVAIKTAALKSDLRVMVFLSLVLPQMALTLTNSVVATVDVAKKYFGASADKVTEKNLLFSIGAGNILSALWGGLPYCHGSGGITAHYRGGAKTWFSNCVIGVFLLGIAAYGFFAGHPVVIGYPPALLASLLMAVGFFHVGLAKNTWAVPTGKIQLALSGLTAIFTHNMLAVLAVAILSLSIHLRPSRESLNAYE